MSPYLHYCVHSVWHIEVSQNGGKDGPWNPGKCGEEDEIDWLGDSSGFVDRSLGEVYEQDRMLSEYT